MTNRAEEMLYYLDKTETRTSVSKLSVFVGFPGVCVLSTNLAFRNEEEEEASGNLAVFIIACILLVFGLVAVVFLVRHSRSKSAPPDIPPRGYEKLGSGGGYGGGSRIGGYSSSSSASYGGRASSSGGRFKEAELVDIGERRLGSKDDDDDDDEDEDIVYMGQDGTVYRKFRYGQLGEDNEDELEYDDESYTFRWSTKESLCGNTSPFSSLPRSSSSLCAVYLLLPRGTDPFILHWIWVEPNETWEAIYTELSIHKMKHAADNPTLFCILWVFT